MAEESHFTVFVRLPYNRGDFIDPPPVSWSASKERALWDVISRQAQGKGNEIDWNTLAEQFEVTPSFILQQAAWLYERQLSQVRAQMRKVGTRQSATSSPAPGSVASSVVGAQAMRRAGSGGSRAPSRLSNQQLGSNSLAPEGNASPIPTKSRVSLPLRVLPSQAAQARSASGPSKPPARPASKDVDPQTSHSRRGSTQQTLSRSPGQYKEPASDSENEEQHQMTQSKYMTRRTNPSSVHRRSTSLRKDRAAQSPNANAGVADADDDDDTYLPFAADAPETALSRYTTTSTQDPSATLKGELTETTPQRPTVRRRSTKEKAGSQNEPQAEATTRSTAAQQLSASTSSSASNPGAPLPTRSHRAQGPSSNRSAQTLSPRQQAALASAGLSPRRQGSESSPSMGSSFSDLDEASVTQSALEEALMSGLGNTTNTMASRVSGIGQAFSRRYFDARQNER